MRETRESARMISCLRITLKGILPLATLAELSLMRGFAPHPSREQGPLHSQQKGLSPLALRAFTPRSPLGRGAGRSPAPIGIAYGAGDATRGKGLRPARSLSSGALPLRYRAHPFPLHFSPKDPFIFCKGHTYRRAEPICLSAIPRGQKRG